MKNSFRPKETIFELLGGGGTEAKGDMDQVMGAVRKRARVHRLMTRNESSLAAPPEDSQQRQQQQESTSDQTVGSREVGDNTVGVSSEVAGGDSYSGDEKRDSMEVAEDEDGGATGADTVAGDASHENGSAEAGVATESAGHDRGGVKRKVSRFERKRMKKRGRDNGSPNGIGTDDSKAGGMGGVESLAGFAGEEEEEAGVGGGIGAGAGGVMGNGRGGPGRFADKSFYIGYGTT